MCLVALTKIILKEILSQPLGTYFNYKRFITYNQCPPLLTEGMRIDTLKFKR